MSNVCTVQPHDGHTTSRLPNPRLLRRRLFIDFALGGAGGGGTKGIAVNAMSSVTISTGPCTSYKFELQSQLSLALLARDVGPDPAGHFRLCELQVV